MGDATVATTLTGSATTGSPQKDRVLLAEALVAFNDNNFPQCVQLLSQVSAATAASDPKIVHNMSVAQFYATEQRQYTVFQASIDKLLPPMKEAQPSTATGGNEHGTGSGTATETFHITDTSLLHAHFNRAVVLFHLRQPKAALKILTALQPHLSEMDDTLAQRSGLLTIHLLLNAHQVRRAAVAIEALQKRLSATAPELLADDDDYEEAVVGVTAAAAALALTKSLSGGETSAKDAATSAHQGAGDKATDESGAAERSAAVQSFRWMFRLYKLRCSVLAGRNVLIGNEETAEMAVLRAHQFYNGIDYQMAAKELSKPFAGSRATIRLNGEDHNTVIANNMGIIHFHVRHYAMAVRFFQHALTFDQSAADAVPPPAATADNDAATPPAAAAAAMPVQCIGATKRPEILYNLGVAMLHLQRPHEAFECLLVPLNYYHSNPRIWLRLAEACIMVHSQAGKAQREFKSPVSTVAGAGVYRKFVLQPTPMKYVSDQSQSFAIPSPNLEFASLCLRNAWTLVEFHAAELKVRAGFAAAAAAAGTAASTSTSVASEADHSGPTAAATASTAHSSRGSTAAAATTATINSSADANSASLHATAGTTSSLGLDDTAATQAADAERTECRPSTPLAAQAFRNLRCAVLAASAYVHICLGEYQLALDYARKLAQLEQLPDAYAMLAHLYCAEALIMLDRVLEARQFLEPKFIKELKEDDFVHRGSPDWPINTVDGAHAILTYNLAVTFLLQDEWELARKALAKCHKHRLVQNHVKLALLYMEMQMGNLETCRMMMRHQIPY